MLSRRRFTQFSALALSSAVLPGCGGSDEPLAATEEAGALADRVFSYEAVPWGLTHDGLVSFHADANERGERGYRFMMIKSVFVRDRFEGHYGVFVRDHAMPSARYVYAGHEGAPVALLAELNDMGRKGYRCLPNGRADARSYIKDPGIETVYTYRVLAALPSSPEFLDELESQGADGFRYLWTPGVQGSVFVKDLAQASIFQYEYGSTSRPLLQDLNEHLADGYRFRGDFLARTYMQDSSRTDATVAYELLADAGADWLRQLNEQGQRGLRYVRWRDSEGVLYIRDVARLSSFYGGDVSWE